MTEYASYRAIHDHLIANEPFEGNTMSATISGGVYSVYSYDTLIYTEYRKRCMFWDSGRYSSTTSKHQYHIRQVKGKLIDDLISKARKRDYDRHWR